MTLTNILTTLPGFIMPHFLFHLCTMLRLAISAALIILASYSAAYGNTYTFSQPINTANTPSEVVFEPNVYRLGDWNQDGIVDLIYIKTITGTGSTEIHVFDGATNYTTPLLHASSPLYEINWCCGDHRFEVTDWNEDGYLDIVLITRGATGTGSTEFHVLDGSTNFSGWMLHTGSAIRDDYGNFDYKFADWNRDGWIDAFAIKKSSTGSNSTEIHILDGSTGFQTFIYQTGTPLHETGSEFDFSIIDLTLDGGTDGELDLIAIKKWRSAGTVEIHVLSGRYNFQVWVVQSETAISAIDGNYQSHASVYRSLADGLPKLAIVNQGNFVNGQFVPGTVEVAGWPAGVDPTPVLGTTYRVINCGTDRALVEARKDGSTLQSMQLLPGDLVGAMFFVPNGETQEMWLYNWYGTPPNWNGGFYDFLVGSTVPSRTIQLGYCN
jgi:hypothetical protein